MVHLLKPTVTTSGSNILGIELAWGETIRSRNLEFIADRFNNLSLFPEGSDSGAVFVGMAHNESPSLHVILEDSTSEDDSISCEGGSSVFPISRECNMVILVVPIATTPLPEGTPVPLTVPTIPMWTVVP
jgi:hypothetical protein